MRDQNEGGERSRQTGASRPPDASVANPVLDFRTALGMEALTQPQVLFAALSALFSAPVITQIDAANYDLIVILRGQDATEIDYRGVRAWSDGMWSAIRRTYRPACVFEDVEIWLPRQGSREILASLSAVGCRTP